MLLTRALKKSEVGKALISKAKPRAVRFGFADEGLGVGCGRSRFCNFDPRDT